MEELKASLRAAIEKNRREKKDVDQKTDDELFEEEFRAVNLGQKLSITEASPNTKNLSQIPRFYSALPADNDELGQKLREEARAQFLQRRSRSLLDNEELKKLYSLLEANSCPSNLSIAGNSTAGASAAQGGNTSGDPPMPNSPNSRYF